MKNNENPRHFARWIALQRLFNIAFLRSDETVTIFEDHQLKEFDGIGNIDEKLCEDIVKGVSENIEKLNQIIQKQAPERPIDQISKIDLQILYIAIFEGFLSKITPVKVAINEAIELTKDFATESDRKFVSGVLGNLIKDNEVD